MFKMTLNQSDGVMLISYSGIFTIYDAMLFRRELQAKLRMIRPEEYVLVVDMQEIRLSTPQLAQLLDEIKHIYVEAPFRMIYSVESDGWLVPKLKRKDSGKPKPNWARVQTVDEALDLMRRGRISEKKDASP